MTGHARVKEYRAARLLNHVIVRSSVEHCAVIWAIHGRGASTVEVRATTGGGVPRGAPSPGHNAPLVWRALFVLPLTCERSAVVGEAIQVLRYVWLWAPRNFPFCGQLGVGSPRIRGGTNVHDK